MTSFMQKLPTSQDFMDLFCPLYTIRNLLRNSKIHQGELQLQVAPHLKENLDLKIPLMTGGPGEDLGLKPDCQPDCH